MIHATKDSYKIQNLFFPFLFSVDEGKSPVIPYVYVNSSGMVKNYKPIQVVSACDLEIYAFPFDKQNCTLTFRSWLHSGKFFLPSVGRKYVVLI